MSSRIWSLSQEISPKSFLVCGLFDISFFNCSTKKLTSIKHMWNKGTVFKSHHQCVRDRFMCCCYTLMLLTDVCKKKTDPILQPAVICASSFLPWHFPLFSGPHLALCDHFTACRTRTFCIFPLF